MIYDHPTIESIYHSGAPWLQNAMVSAYGLLQLTEPWFGAGRRYSAELAVTQWHSPQQLQLLQEQRLRAMISHVYDNVPYYRRVFDERKLKPADIQTVADLYKLPVLTRQDVRRHRADLRARNIPAKRITKGRSGGTTGTAMEFLLDKHRIIFDHALTRRHWAWAGYRPGDRTVVLRPSNRLFFQESIKHHWRRDWFGNRYYLTTTHLSRANLPRYVDLLRQWRPKYLAGFAAGIAVVAKYLESCGAEVPMRGVFTSSEMLAPADRELIERSFACRAWDRYGANERLVVGQQCQHGSYHQAAEYGLLQVDWPRGEPAAPGARGELIHTGLTNFSMPFIRYASEDVGCLVEGPCACGRGLPRMGPVEGRRMDMLVSSDGRLILGSGLAGFQSAIHNVERCQVVQRRIGEIIVRVVPGPSFGEADTAALKRKLVERMGPGTDVRLELVESLTLAASGKNRPVVSEVDLEQVTGLSLRME